MFDNLAQEAFYRFMRADLSRPDLMHIETLTVTRPVCENTNGSGADPSGLFS